MRLVSLSLYATIPIYAFLLQAPGVDFGVEASAKSSRSAAANANESQSDKVKRSNREAARLFTEMFSMLGTTSVVLFPSESEASTARSIWTNTFKGQVLSIDAPKAQGYGKLRSRRFTLQEQEQALMATDGIYVPEGTELLIIAGPRQKDMKKIRKIHERLGMDCLIILLNARAAATSASLPGNLNKNADGSASANSEESSSEVWIDNTFVNVFNYSPPYLASEATKGTATTLAAERELLVYHEFESKWYLAEKPKAEGGSKGGVGNILGNSGGGFQTLWEGVARPSAAEIESILQSVKPVEANINGA
jgi:Domain of unknown function (DUF1995)